MSKTYFFRIRPELEELDSELFNIKSDGKSAKSLIDKIIKRINELRAMLMGNSYKLSYYERGNVEQHIHLITNYLNQCEVYEVIRKINSDEKFYKVSLIDGDSLLLPGSKKIATKDGEVSISCPKPYPVYALKDEEGYKEVITDTSITPVEDKKDSTLYHNGLEEASYEDVKEFYDGVVKEGLYNKYKEAVYKKVDIHSKYKNMIDRRR